ncbi:MAG: bifunctional nuclease family protein [Bacteroidia bacterium]|nr:bifunctional nuclease family protein [Bacteroidia bacterium]
MKRIKLNVLGLSYSQTQSGAYALILADEESNQRIPIIIGSAEAQAIAIELESLKPPRPLTHDLFVDFASAFGINLIEVNISKLEEGVFYSDLIFDNGYERIKIDSRTSDAIALALKFKCPIYTTSDILSKTGIILNFEKDEKSEKTDVSNNPEKIEKSQKTYAAGKGKNEFAEFSISELDNMLNKFIKNEEYEKASLVRDEIKKRKGKP